MGVSLVARARERRVANNTFQSSGSLELIPTHIDEINHVSDTT
jgi:hypothetical protein